MAAMDHISTIAVGSSDIIVDKPPVVSEARTSDATHNGLHRNLKGKPQQNTGVSPTPRSVALLAKEVSSSTSKNTVLDNTLSRNPTVDVLVSRLRTYLPQADSNLVRYAYTFAYTAHHGQRRQSGEPYITHPIAVANILLDLHMDDPPLPLRCCTT